MCQVQDEIKAIQAYIDGLPESLKTSPYAQSYKLRLIKLKEKHARQNQKST